MDYQIFYLEETDSTNNWAKREAKKGAEDRSVYMTDKQTAGKGRRGKTWENAAKEDGGNIMMSLLLRPGIRLESAPMLTLVMGLSAAQAVFECTDVKVSIKWPNDLVLCGKKICGILTEMSVAGGRPEYVVIGIGINVRKNQLSEEVDKIAASLEEETGRPIDRDILIQTILKKFEENYHTFQKTQDLSGLIKPYQELLVNTGRKIQVLGEKESYTGICLGINEKGELLVEKEDGTKCTVYAGEVSVRGVYGYV